MAVWPREKPIAATAVVVTTAPAKFRARKVTRRIPAQPAKHAHQRARHSRQGRGGDGQAEHPAGDCADPLRVLRARFCS